MAKHRPFAKVAKELRRARSAAEEAGRQAKAAAKRDDRDGVQRIEGKHRVAPPLSEPPVRAPVAPKTVFVVEADAGWVAGRRQEASERDVRRLRRAIPQGTIDLHGQTYDEAKKALVAFLADRRRRGEEAVLVVAGKGRHSPGGRSVLREALVDWLTDVAAVHVHCFVTAPPDMGGHGAVMVRLTRWRTPGDRP